MRHWRLPALALTFSTALLSTQSYAQSAPPVANSFTQEMHPSTVYGAGASVSSLTLQTGSNTGNIYLQFSLAAIPADATVQKATLQLYVNQVLGAGSFDVYELNSEWNQGTLTYANAPGLGVSATGNHPVAIPAAADQFILVDVTPLVQDWVNGVSPNYGMVLSMTTLSGGALFDSKEATLTSHMPELQIVLNGPAGPQGPMGPAGPPGTSGTGTQTTTGSGFNFRNAFDPTATYSPYDVVTYNGSTYDALVAIAPGGATPDMNPGWALMAEQGASGATGPQGPIGLTGAAGVAGPQGIQGVPGMPGATGPQGPIGPTGATGQAGPQGAMGPAGPAGAPGGTGSQVTTGTGFNFRDTFDPTATYSAYDVVTYNGSTYDSLGAIEPGGATPDINPSWALMAQRGDDGAIGPQGPIGATGATGATGPQGPIGLTGPTGAAGAQGIQGLTGAAGETGPVGPQGVPGAIGPQGAVGPPGAAGPGFNFRNAFDPTATYSPYDVVTYNGSTYDSLAAIEPGGATPDLNPSWALMAQQGAKGPAGAAGPNSVSTATASAVAGLIKGSGGTLAAAIAGTDYVIPSGSITGNAATATQLSTTGPNGTFWGVSGGVQGFYQPGLIQGVTQQAGSGGNCQAVTASSGSATVNWATSSCAVITAGGSNVTSITLSNPSSGTTYSLGLCNDGSPRVWALPGTLKQASIPNYASECVYKIYTYDGANYQGPGSTANPTVIYGSERSAPAPSPTGAFVCWWDSSNHVMTCNDNGGPTANMVVPAVVANNNQFVSYIDSSGIQHMGQPGFSVISGMATAAQGGTGVANTATLTLGTTNVNLAALGTGIVKNTTGLGALTNAASSDVIGLFAGCSGTQYLGADGACHTASGSGTVTTTSSPAIGNIAKFSGATSITSAAFSDIVGLWAGCSGTQYLGADGNCHAASGSGTVTSSASPVPGNIAQFTNGTNIAPATFAQIAALWSGCSGSQYLGFDGSCHTASGSGTVQNVTFTGDGIVDSSTPSTAVSSTGTVTATPIAQNAATALTGPISGSAASPSFKTLSSIMNACATVGNSSDSADTIGNQSSAAGQIYSTSCTITTPSTANTIDGTHHGIELTWLEDQSGSGSPTWTVKLGICPTANISGHSCSSGFIPLLSSIAASESITGPVPTEHSFDVIATGTPGTFATAAIRTIGGQNWSVSNSTSGIVACGATCTDGASFSFVLQYTWSAASNGTCNGVGANGTDCSSVTGARFPWIF